MRSFVRVSGIAAMVVCLMATGCANKDRIAAQNEMNEGLLRAQGGGARIAIDHLQRAIEIDVTFGEPYFYMGMIRLRRLHSPTRAIADLSMAIERLPDTHAKFSEAHYLLGQAYEAIEQYTEAQQALERAVEIDPRNHRAFFALGKLFDAKGETMNAIEAYSSSIEANPRFIYPYLELGRIYARYEAWEGAIGVFSEGLRINGESTDEDIREALPTVWNSLGEMYLMASQLEQAVAAFEEAYQADTVSPIFNFNLGVAYARSFQISESEGDREKAIEYLEYSRERCGALGSQARCNLLNMTLDALMAVDEDE